MSEPASISSGIADRYATAVFDLYKENGQIDGLEADTKALTEALEGSEDLRTLLTSPLISREAQEAGIAALAQKMKLGETLTNTLRLMAQKRRLFAVPQVLTALKNRVAEDKGVISAEVTSAVALTDDQAKKLAKTLKAKLGKKVEIETTVDESLIGGLIVKVGSQMIDTSVASKLSALQNSMKEVG